MAKTHIRVSQAWRRHFAAPAAIMRSASRSNDILAVDEDAGLYLINPAGTTLLSRQLPWMPAAAAIDRDAHRIAVISPGGTLLVMDRSGNTAFEARTVLKPTSLDLSYFGDMIVFADGSGRVGMFDVDTRRIDFRPPGAPYHYVRFVSYGSNLLAVGQYGQVLFDAGKNKSEWQKDYHCHTRLPAFSQDPLTILIPSPYYGIISLRPDGGGNGLFEVPDGPKCVAVNASGSRVFVVNEKNDLIIFEADGHILFRQSIGAGIVHIECDAEGVSLAAMTTIGSIEKYSVGESAIVQSDYLEFATMGVEKGLDGPETIWKTKVFSALGGSRGGLLAVTPSARFVALLDIEGGLRIYDKSGAPAGQGEKLYGRAPTVKAARATDLVVAASSDALLAVDLRSYRQRRLALKNEWTTHFDVAPRGIFFAVADFFRGVSLFDETLDRSEYLETASDVVDIAVDGNHTVCLALADSTLAFYTANGGLLCCTDAEASSVRSLVSLVQGFVAATETRVNAYDSEGNAAWSVEIPGEISSIQPTRAGLAVLTGEGDTFITNAHGTVTNKVLKRSQASYFAAQPPSREIISIEARGRLLTARSTDSGVLWRREMEDDILAMEVSPEGSFVAVNAGINLYVLSTAIGQKPPEQRLYLEI